MSTLTPSLSRRKEILKRISHDHPQWKPRIAVAIVLWIVTMAVIAMAVFLLIQHPTSSEGIILIIGTGICFACVPHFIALSVKNKAKYKCGLPYTSYANGTLFLNDDSLEYLFWRVGPREPAAYSSKRAVYKDEDKFVYRITKTDINSVDFKGDICRINGNGFVQMPEWAEEDATVKRNNKEFSFIMAFEQKNAKDIIAEWRK